MKTLTLSVSFLFLVITIQAQNQSKVFDSKTLQSNILKMERKYSIYLPEGYESSELTYPVLYLLHPAGPSNTIPNQQSWYYYGGLKQYLDKAIESGEITPMIVVTPDANFETKRISYWNDPEGDFNFEDYFFEEFIPYIEKNYRCRTERDSRALAGASLGGAAVVQYIQHHPEKFSVACALAGAVRKFDYDYLRRKFPNVSERKLMDWYKSYDVFAYYENLPDDTESSIRLYISCGDDDHLSPNNAMLHTVLKKKGIEHEFRIQNGAHDWSYWRSVTPEFIKYISDSFRK